MNKNRDSFNQNDSWQELMEVNAVTMAQIVACITTFIVCLVSHISNTDISGMLSIVTITLFTYNCYLFVRIKRLNNLLITILMGLGAIYSLVAFVQMTAKALG
jgi:ABC-type multidrug transport system fused ATPase/permease subunit